MLKKYNLKLLVQYFQFHTFKLASINPVEPYFKKPMVREMSF